MISTPGVPLKDHKELSQDLLKMVVHTTLVLFMGGSAVALPKTIVHHKLTANVGNNTMELN